MAIRMRRLPSLGHDKHLHLLLIPAALPPVSIAPDVKLTVALLRKTWPGHVPLHTTRPRCSSETAIDSVLQLDVGCCEAYRKIYCHLPEAIPRLPYRAHPKYASFDVCKFGRL